MKTEARGSSPQVLLVTLLSLLALAGASFAFRFMNIGAFGYGVALAITLVKAGLVATFFMEIGAERASVHFAFASGLALIVLLLSLTVADVLTRTPPPLTAPPGMAQRDVG